jgi:hypothetical protein
MKAHPELQKIDFTKIFTIEFIDFDKTYAANTIWLDDIMLHKSNAERAPIAMQ